jgi:hypothetical protein
VRELRDDIGEPPESHALTEYENGIDPGLAGGLRDIIGKVEAEVGRIGHELRLPRSKSSILRKHLASLQLLSIDLYATLPYAGLQGYDSS